MQGVGFREYGIGFRIQVVFRVQVQCPEFKVQGLEFRVQELKSRVQGLGIRVQGLVLRVQGLRFSFRGVEFERWGSVYRFQESGCRVQDSGFGTVQGLVSKIQVQPPALRPGVRVPSIYFPWNSPGTEVMEWSMYALGFPGGGVLLGVWLVQG